MMKKIGADSIGGGGGISGCLVAVKKSRKTIAVQIGNTHSAYHAHFRPCRNPTRQMMLVRMDMMRS